MESLVQIFLAVVLFVSGLLPAGATLSYVAPERIVEEPKVASILFGGDMMFDRTVRQIAEKKGGDYVFECIDEELKNADLVVANLEGPITGNKSVSVGTRPPDSNNFMFTFPTSTARNLARHGIKLVNLGNNHILNFGWKGLASTTEWLTDAGVDYFGDPRDQRVARAQIRGIRFAFINYNQFAPPPSSASTTVLQIRDARVAGELPIVFTHWGDEYIPATPLEKRLAHLFIDEGAELVIGTHPHVIQEHELYTASTTNPGPPKHIYYSLGNLIFDQYWEAAVRNGLLLRVFFDENGVSGVAEIPVESRRDKNTCVISSNHE